MERAEGAGELQQYFRGLALQLHYDGDEDLRPVGMVETYLADSQISRVGRETFETYAEEQAEAERQEGLANARPAEL